MTSKQSNFLPAFRDYRPNSGIIGQSEVEVANYLVSCRNQQLHYKAPAQFIDQLFAKGPADNYLKSQLVTRFLRRRDLSFAKHTAKGPKIFTVPCTTSVIPMQLSLFRQVERAAQVLVVTLRKILQDIYGASSLEASHFVRSLPDPVRALFLQSIRTSAHYIPQLHHPNMASYPFFDNVGLDLVLVEDYLLQTRSELPFKILELNAGAPSGASNNLNILEGVYRYHPELLETLGRFMANDHFECLYETYSSLGRGWTGLDQSNGAVVVMIPPGGENGATPELHQLAALSGLIYTDPSQLYCDEEGFIRLRTISGHNPIVSAIYSRVNADSVLYNPAAGIVLRDPEEGTPLYLKDYLRYDDQREDAPDILDEQGRPVLLESNYEVPGILKAIHERKIYLGGLNRILDNKIILDTLVSYGPQFYVKELAALGLTLDGPKIAPPTTLASSEDSVATIEQNLEDWVIKTPNLSGGTGVYIMKTLNERRRKEVLKLIRERPQEFAFQQLVKIGRIPVAMQNRQGHARYANLACDLRMWVFYGADEEGCPALPRITYNALARYAPHERGPMSSIVNTSKGGGYAPFVVVDDQRHADAVDAAALVAPRSLAPMQCDLPIFVAAQLVQLSVTIRQIAQMVTDPQKVCSGWLIYDHVWQLKRQFRELASFLNPCSMEHLHALLDHLTARGLKGPRPHSAQQFALLRLQFVEYLRQWEPHVGASGWQAIEQLRFLDEAYALIYGPNDQKHDLELLQGLGDILPISSFSEKVAQLECAPLVTAATKARVLKELSEFLVQARSRLRLALPTSPFRRIFADLYEPAICRPRPFRTLGLASTPRTEALFATQWEMIHERSLVATNSEWIPQWMQQARQAWQRREGDEDEARQRQFALFPQLQEYQQLIDTPECARPEQILKMLEILPYAAYNVRKFCQLHDLQSLLHLFVSTPTANRVALLNREQRSQTQLNSGPIAGECFAQKRQQHGLISQSDIYIWMAMENGPLALAYTLGHELIHYHQIADQFQAEQEAIEAGPISFALFLAYYGHYLGAIREQGTVQTSGILAEHYQPLYGLADLLNHKKESALVRELQETLCQDPQTWANLLHDLGALIGLCTPTAPQTKAKALNEILPAIENGKNLLFARQLGLRIPFDEVRSVLPTANQWQLNRFRPQIVQLLQNPIVNRPELFESLRLVANCQLFGVRFAPDAAALTLPFPTTPLFMGQGYNQTQQ